MKAHSFLALVALVSMLLGIPLGAPSAHAEISTILANCEFSATSTLAGKNNSLQIEFTYLSLAGIPSNDPRQYRYDLIQSDSTGPFARTTVQQAASGHTYSTDHVSLSIDPTRVDSQGHILAVYADTRANGAAVADPAMTCTMSTSQSGIQSRKD